MMPEELGVSTLDTENPAKDYWPSDYCTEQK